MSDTKVAIITGAGSGIGLETAKLLHAADNAVLGVGRTALWRTRAAYLQGGLELALFDIARPGRPRRPAKAAGGERAAR